VENPYKKLIRKFISFLSQPKVNFLHNGRNFITTLCGTEIGSDLEVLIRFLLDISPPKGSFAESWATAHSLRSLSIVCSRRICNIHISDTGMTGVGATESFYGTHLSRNIGETEWICTAVPIRL
jgi:hypothetical protein